MLLSLLPTPFLLLLAQAPSVPLMVRIVASLAILPLLYRALGQPGEGWTGGAPRRAAFTLTGAAVFFMLTAQWFPEQKEPGSGKGFQAYSMGSLQHRANHSGLEIGFSETRDGSVVQNLRKAAEQVPESAFFKRHLGIALADTGKYAEALRALNASMDILAERAPQRAAEERRLWNTLYGPQKPTPTAIQQAEAQLESYNLGWLARVAALAAYKRLGESPPKELVNRVEDQARSYFRGLIFSLVIAFLIIPQLGLIALVVGAVLIGARVVRPVERDQHPVGAVLWESFILMMALGILPVFIPGRPAPETQPGYYAVLLVVRDAFQLLAIGYLWWRLRSKRLTLAEIGLGRRHLGANVAVGVMAALVMVPSAYLIGILTQFVSDRFFPHVAPPYHPLSGMTATSGSWEIRAALFMAAVIGAPLLEEIFFRGALFGALRRRFGFWWGLLGSSAFFAILHPQLPLGFLPIAALGAAFAALYEWRQSLVPAMVAHAINNGVAFFMLNSVFPRGG